MADLRPFPGLRPRSPHLRQEDLCAPPFDAIGEEAREALAAKSARNVVHLTLGGPIGGDWHREAGRKFRSWIDEGVLRREEAPCYYLYEHEFEHRGKVLRRLGFIGILRLEDGPGVHPHERTFEAPILDRLELIRATQANLEPIFLTYRDPGLSIRRILEAARAEEGVEVRGVLEGTHRLRPIRDPEMIEALREGIREKDLLVADGHHRHAVALRHRDEMAARSGGMDPEAPWNFRMAYLSAVEDPGMVILPTHRVVSVSGPEKRGEALKRLFDRFPFGPELSAEEALDRLAEARPASPALGVYVDGKVRLLEKSEEGLDRGEDQEVLPAALLHEQILEPVFGVAPEELFRHVRFIRSPEEVRRRVDAGGGDVGFFLRPVSPETVWRRAVEGGVMPQKSTDFFPKLLSGLVFYRY